MTKPLHTVALEALALDPADRLRLATELIDSVEGPPDSEWAEAWSAELGRRTAAAEARQARGEPRGGTWEDVRTRILAEFSETP